MRSRHASMMKLDKCECTWWCWKCILLSLLAQNSRNTNEFKNIKLIIFDYLKLVSEKNHKTVLSTIKTEFNHFTWKFMNKKVEPMCENIFRIFCVFSFIIIRYGISQYYTVFLSIFFPIRGLIWLTLWLREAQGGLEHIHHIIRV